LLLLPPRREKSSHFFRVAAVTAKHDGDDGGGGGDGDENLDENPFSPPNHYACALRTSSSRVALVICASINLFPPFFPGWERLHVISVGADGYPKSDSFDASTDLGPPVGATPPPRMTASATTAVCTSAGASASHRLAEECAAEEETRVVLRAKRPPPRPKSEVFLDRRDRDGRRTKRYSAFGVSFSSVPFFLVREYYEDDAESRRGVKNDGWECFRLVFEENSERAHARTHALSVPSVSSPPSICLTRLEEKAQSAKRERLLVSRSVKFLHGDVPRADLGRASQRLAGVLAEGGHQFS